MGPRQNTMELHSLQQLGSDGRNASRSRGDVTACAHAEATRILREASKSCSQDECQQRHAAYDNAVSETESERPGSHAPSGRARAASNLPVALSFPKLLDKSTDWLQLVMLYWLELAQQKLHLHLLLLIQLPWLGSFASGSCLRGAEAEVSSSAAAFLEAGRPCKLTRCMDTCSPHEDCIQYIYDVHMTCLALFTGRLSKQTHPHL